MSWAPPPTTPEPPSPPPRRATPQSPAAVRKRLWRKAQQKWGVDRSVVDMTESQIWSLVRILVLIVNTRDDPYAPQHLLHGRALQRKLGWQQGTLQPRLQRLESLGWVYTTHRRVRIKDRTAPVLCYGITPVGEAVATIWSPYLIELLTIVPRERRRV